jgi:hypothetical protein
LLKFNHVYLRIRNLGPFWKKIYAERRNIRKEIVIAIIEAFDVNGAERRGTERKNAKHLLFELVLFAAMSIIPDGNASKKRVCFVSRSVIFRNIAKPEKRREGDLIMSFVLDAHFVDTYQRIVRTSGDNFTAPLEKRIDFKL